MKWTIAITDDLEMDRSRLEKDVSKWFAKQGLEAEVFCYESGPAMLADFAPDKFQLAFLDIRMDDMTGIQLADQLRSLDASLLICFLTTSREYAFDAFPLHPFDYLIKPYKEEQLNHVLAEALRALSGTEPEISVRVSRGEYQVPYSHIVSVVSQGHAVTFKLSNGPELRSSMNFSEVERLLTADERFLLCNRGILINMDHVSSMSDDLFTMTDGSVYGMRTKGRGDLIKQFSQYQILRMRRGR